MFQTVYLFINTRKKKTKKNKESAFTTQTNITAREDCNSFVEFHKIV